MRVLISSVSGEAPSEASAGKLRQIADGVLCDHHDEDWIGALVAAGLRVVRVDHLGTDPGAPELDTVVQDDFGGISSAVRYFRERGHRRIGYLDFTAGFPPGRRGSAARRLGAYVGASRRLGLQTGLELVAAVSEPAAADGATRKLVGAGATALIVPHKFLLEGALAGLAAGGVSLPGSFGLVVWGEPTAREGQEDYPSHVAWSKEQMGREAVRRLTMRLRRPETPVAEVCVPARLVDRGTGGSGPDGARED
jgi:DNA-binding LacI/PurR family transcriptional regulator